MHFERDEGWCIGWCAELPDAAGNGPTYPECLQSLRESIAGLLGVDPRELTDSNLRGEPPFRLIAEADRMEEEIRSVFADVTREGGVSWSETEVLDAYGSELERREARANDTELHWTDLVKDEKWNPDCGVGGWSFIDAIGFRYYLPAAMIRCLRTRLDCGIQDHLELPPRDNQLYDHALSKWSALDDSQRSCVARFIRCMILISDGDLSRQWWAQAFDSYWSQFLPREQ